MLMQKEPFDYTKWQENLFQDMTIDEIYNKAAALRCGNESSSGYRKRMISNIKLFFIDIGLTILITTIHICAAKEINKEELLACIIMGTAIFIFLLFQDYLVNKHNKITVTIKYQIERFILLLFFVYISINLICDIKNIISKMPALILFKGNVEIMIFFFIKQKKDAKVTGITLQ